MRTIIFLTLTLSLLFLNTTSARKEITEMNINGMQLIFKQAENDVVVVNLFIKGGAANLTPETAGIENYALQVAVTGGTKNYAKDEFNKNLEKLGSTITASSSNDFSVISLRCVKDNFAKTWELYENVILNPLFDEIEVNLTRDKITSSIKTEDTNPDALIRKTMVKWYFEGHPYSNRQIGTTENIQKFSPDDLKNYYKQILENSRLLMVAVGRLDKKDLEKKTNALSSKLPAGSYKDTKLSPPKRSESSEYQIVEKPLPTNYIMGQYLLPNMNEPYYYAALLSHSILRDRVFEEVRTKRNLSYAPVAAMTTQKTSTGFIYVSTTNPDTAIMVMLDELNKLKTETIPEKDMKNHKMRFLTLDYMRQETNAMQAGALAAAQIYTGSWKNVALFVENIDKVTGDDIKTMSNDYINNLNFVYVGKKNKVNEEILKTK
ncbi:MAG: insulinase family protein [Bacteroidetes bacterium]|nr:insulinase family protein [Bacteroidota bacterium]